jgi:hypothetical protein
LLARRGWLEFCPYNYLQQAPTNIEKKKRNYFLLMFPSSCIRYAINNLPKAVKRLRRGKILTFFELWSWNDEGFRGPAQICEGQHGCNKEVCSFSILL